MLLGRDLRLVHRAGHDHQRQSGHDEHGPWPRPNAQHALDRQYRERDREPLERVIGKRAGGLQVDEQRGERPDADGDGLPVARGRPVGERGRQREWSDAQGDRPPRPCPGRLAARGVGLGGELPGRVENRQREVVSARQRHRSRHREHAERRPLTRAPPAEPLRRQHDQGKRPALPRLKPAHDEGARRRQHERARAARFAPALDPEQYQRHQEHREPCHQVAPQVLPGPHLAGDEVERVLARVPAPVAPGDERRGGHHREQHQQKRGVASSARRQQAAHVEQRADEHHAHRHRLPEQVGERHGEAGQRVHQAREQEARVEEHAVVRLEVVAVADQPVLGRLADPGEVLELIGGEHAVGARDRPALGEQRGQDSQ